jgi:hypothetical protein
MLRHLRSAGSVRLAVGVAVFAAILGAAGLHPEPALGFTADSTLGLIHSATPTASHGCLACLTHGAALASPISGIVAPGAPATPDLPPAVSDGYARIVPRDLAGRSPPSNS